MYTWTVVRRQLVFQFGLGARRSSGSKLVAGDVAVLIHRVQYPEMDTGHRIRRWTPDTVLVGIFLPKGTINSIPGIRIRCPSPRPLREHQTSPPPCGTPTTSSSTTSQSFDPQHLVQPSRRRGRVQRLLRHLFRRRRCASDDSFINNGPIVHEEWSASDGEAGGSAVQASEQQDANLLSSTPDEESGGGRSMSPDFNLFASSSDEPSSNNFDISAVKRRARGRSRTRTSRRNSRRKSRRSGELRERRGFRF